MDYLLKVTIAWTFFLLLFEVAYKNNGKFVANRIYLLLGIALGLLLPLIPLPSSAPAVFTATQKFYTEAQNQYTATSAAPVQAIPVQAAPGPVAAPASQAGTHGPDLAMIIAFIYGLGVLILLVKCLVELSRIARLIFKNPPQMLYGQKVIATGSTHAPYSFMGRIFLTDPAAHSPQELAFIIRHEAAHNTGKHWLDLWLVHLACIAFWFHPLIWRYRYLLQLQHEYEADDRAAGNDPYTYGHFLLQQTLLNGVPSIAHSFHFSPVKNRIHMLTKKHSFKSGGWKYLLLAPALLGCSFLMAKTGDKLERTLQGNEKMFNGNIFKWRESEASYANPDHKDEKPKIIFEMNGETVYQNEKLGKPAMYGNTERAYLEYVGKEFAARVKNTLDSLTGTMITALVINKEGKVVYYEVQYGRPYSKYKENQKLLYPFPKPETILNGIVDDIISKGPSWKPAVLNGKPVNTFLGFSDGC